VCVGEQSQCALFTVRLKSTIACSCACHPLDQGLLGVTSSYFNAPSLHAFPYQGRAIMPHSSVCSRQRRARHTTRRQWTTSATDSDRYSRYMIKLWIERGGLGWQSRGAHRRFSCPNTVVPPSCIRPSTPWPARNTASMGACAPARGICARHKHAVTQEGFQVPLASHRQTPPPPRPGWSGVPSWQAHRFVR